MTEAPRPVYVGFGQCDSGHLEVRLYRVQGEGFKFEILCTRCFRDRGLEAPKPRTAEDIEVVDGVPRWKDET